MKKLMISLCFICFTLNSFANVIENIRLGKESLIFDIASEIPKYTVDFVPEMKMIMLEFENTSVLETVENLLVNGKFIEKIELVKVDDFVDVFIYLQLNSLAYKVEELKDPSRVVFKFENNNKKDVKIVIDPGHGGKDPGAIGYKGLQEKDIVLAISKYLKEELKDDYNIVMTREDDSFVSLTGRAKMVNAEKADLLVSMHANANNDKRANGTEVFFYSKSVSDYAKSVSEFENSVDKKYGIKEDYTDLIVNEVFYKINQDKSKSLALITEEGIASGAGFKERGTHGGNFSVLRNSSAPGILIELAFITNRNEAAKLNSVKYQKEIAKRIANGIRKYFD